MPTGILNMPWAADVVEVGRLRDSVKKITGIEPEVRPARGVFAEMPSSTPKWVGRGGPAEADFRNTMARMFIQLNQSELKRFITSVSLTDDTSGSSTALASVLASTGTKDYGTGYIDFLLQSVQMPAQEKASVVETLADNFVIYYFGAAAVPWTFAGTCLNTYEDDQGINMLRMYRDIMRGTQLAKRRKLLRIRFNNMIVGGSVMSLNLGLEADNEMAMPFSLQLMPKTITLMPNDIYGLVVPTDAAEDSHYRATTEIATGLTGGPPAVAPGIAPTNNVGISDVGAENEAEQSLASTAEDTSVGEPLPFNEQSLEVPQPTPGGR